MLLSVAKDKSFHSVTPLDNPISHHTHNQTLWETLYWYVGVCVQVWCGAIGAVCFHP